MVMAKTSQELLYNHYSCKHCGKDFQKKCNLQAYCSPSCRRNEKLHRLNIEHKNVESIRKDFTDWQLEHWFQHIEEHKPVMKADKDKLNTDEYS